MSIAHCMKGLLSQYCLRKQVLNAKEAAAQNKVRQPFL